MVSLETAKTVVEILISLYHFARGDKTEKEVQVLEEIRDELKAGHGGSEPRTYVLERVQGKLDPDKAKEVEHDFDVVELLAAPPDLANFDFWSTLVAYVRALHSFATKAQLFRLRGIRAEKFRVLPLETAGPYLIPEELMRKAYRPMSQAYYDARLEAYKAVLVEEPLTFPVLILASGLLMEAYATGGSRSEKCSGYLAVVSGQEAHWLLFGPEEYCWCLGHVNRMLRAEDLLAITEALKHDVIRHAREVQEDQQRLVRDVQPAIQAFLSKLENSNVVDKTTTDEK